MEKRLDEKTFAMLVAAAPLVSIDLLVTDQNGRLLVGKRVNEPAKGSLFVPGGRIEKHYGTLGVALTEIARDELGIEHDLIWDDARLVGVFMHRYDTNALGIANLSTHYIALAYRLRETEDIELDKKRYSNQHSDYAWLDEDNIPDGVHPYTLDYLRRLAVYS